MYQRIGRGSASDTSDAGQEGLVVVGNVRKLPADEGYDALRGDYGNMFDKGIVDPAKVTRSALENAASIAALVLTTESLVTDGALNGP